MKTAYEKSQPENQTLEGAQEYLRHHLEMKRHPLRLIDTDAAASTIDALTGIDPVSWSETWLATASEFATSAQQARDAGDAEAARDAWWQAYKFAFLGRYPVPDHPAKDAAYAKAREYFLKSVSFHEPPVERVEVPFEGRPGEGSTVSFYLARPKDESNPPVVVLWLGIDAWKEEAFVYSEQFLRRGIATVMMDMPGTGESPVIASVDAERLWDPVFDWIAQSDLDDSRVAVMGGSFGGYWAAKLAHTHSDRLKAAVNWGGGIHLTFQRFWQERSRNASSYLMDLPGARARIFNGTTFEDYVARCPELSLIDQGVLEQHCCPLLMVNGKDDLQNAAEDLTLALEYGDPKTVRLYPGGHMGADIPAVANVIGSWLGAILAPKS
jgi:pimeloyl-ACP methyl ester carboxylesterase